MSWTAFHSRGETLRAVVDTANDRHDGVLPTQVPGVDRHFTDETDLVGALLLKWHARLSGNLERALAAEPMDLASAVAAAWRTTSEQLPGLRLVFDRCADAPTTPEMGRAMERARERERIWLATAAGLTTSRGPSAVEAGREVEERARQQLAPATASLPAPREPAPVDPASAAPGTRPQTSSESFVERIKAALVA